MPILSCFCIQEWASQNGVQLSRPDAAQQTTFRLDEHNSRNILQVRSQARLLAGSSTGLLKQQQQQQRMWQLATSVM